MQRSLIFLLSQHTPPLQSSRADIVYSFLLEKFSLFTKLRWFTTSNWNLFSKKPTNIYFQVTNPTNPKLPNIGLKLAGEGGGEGKGMVSGFAFANAPACCARCSTPAAGSPRLPLPRDRAAPRSARPLADADRAQQLPAAAVPPHSRPAAVAIAPQTGGLAEGL